MTDKKLAERDVDDNFNINPKHKAIAALGRKMIDMSSRMTGTDDNTLMMANALSRLGESLESFGASFGPKSMSDVVKMTGMSQDVIQMLIGKAKADKDASTNRAAEPAEGNKFSGELKKAKDAGKDEFEVDGKKHKVKEDEVEESGLQYHTGVKKHGKEYMKKAAAAGRDGASQEELGRLKDKYSKAEKNKKTKEEITTEGPFKGVGKMAMKRKLNKQYKKSDLANFDDSGMDTSGKTPDEIRQMKSDYYHDHMDKADKAKKAGNRLSREEIELEQGFEEMMGQFSETACEECGNQSWTTLEMTEEEIEEGERHGNSKIYDKCWKGYRKVPGKKAGEAGSCKKVESEEEVSEAYINTSKDAVDVLGALRGKGKKIERGQDDDQGNLANQYVSDVWDVYSFIEARTNGFSGLDKNAKAAIDAMMKLRGEAKKLETKPGSGKNGKFGNQIVNTLYPVIEYLYTTDFDRNKKEDDDTIEAKEQKTPLGEFILSYFDRENGAFPKGETAVLTMVEKDYGEQFIEPAKAFIEQIQAKFDEWQMRTQPQQMEDEVDENFTQAAAAAARAHQSEFEYPKGSGKMHPVKMSKGTAHKINDDYDRIRELAGLR